MAISCGGSDLKMEKASMSDLGEVEEFTITKDDAVTLRGKGDPREVEQRMERNKIVSKYYLHLLFPTKNTLPRHKQKDERHERF